MKKRIYFTMQILAVFLLIAWLSGSSYAIDSEHPIVLRFDNDTTALPDYYPFDVPFSILVSMNSWSDTIRDHNGQPHRHGHLVQLIMDGGNGIQDPPNFDGTPGGDDSMAYGNFNLTRIRGIDDPFEGKEGKSGLLASGRYFIPYYNGRLYYLRLWEGDSEKTAPYYQDTVEYTAGLDKGGSMMRLYTAGISPPVDADFKFGPSKPRPKPTKSK